MSIDVCHLWIQEDGEDITMELWALFISILEEMKENIFDYMENQRSIIKHWIWVQREEMP